MIIIIPIIWWLIDAFIIIILSMDSVLCVEYLDVVPYGHKELSEAWTSDNKKLDEFITKSQRQTNSPNEAYLEWIPFDYMYKWEYEDLYTLRDNLPTQYTVSLVLL